jgi:hypothetical protein
MARKLKVETMQKRTAESKKLTLEELEYCKRLIDNIIEDVEKMEYQDVYEPSEEYSDGKYAAEESYNYMVVIRAILSRYWKNKSDKYFAHHHPRLVDRRLESHKALMDRMWSVVNYVDEMDRL